MARIQPLDFTLIYKIEFDAPIRGHHISKETWRAKIGQRLIYHADGEAVHYDKNALGVYIQFSANEQLVGHVPIELSTLLSYFLNASIDHQLTSVVTGKRMREIGLVVPAKFVAYTNNINYANILRDNLMEKTSIIGIKIHTMQIVKLPKFQ